MSPIILAVAVVLIIIIGWRMWMLSETFRPCTDCSGYRMPRRGVAVLNPFVWPYSGTQCVDDLYILNRDKGVDFGFGGPPLFNGFTPDHVALTG